MGKYGANAIAFEAHTTTLLMTHKGLDVALLSSSASPFTTVVDCLGVVLSIE